MTEQDIFNWGDKAEALIANNDYIALYERVTMDIAKEILTTPITDHEHRNHLYHTFAGMREFGYRLNGMIREKELTIARQNADNAQDDTESD